MTAIIKLDSALVMNRLGYRAEVEGLGKPAWTEDYRGIFVGAVLPEKPELVVNAKLSLQLDCSIEPVGGGYTYHALLAVNPKLFEVAEVSAPTLFLPRQGRSRPVIHLRGLKKFDLSELDWIASLHLID